MLSDDWTLAVVHNATHDGQPLPVLPCDRVVWVRVEQLHRASDNSEDLRTGCTVAFPDRTEVRLGRTAWRDFRRAVAGAPSVPSS
ncbi:MAG: hypothetical protein HKP61_22290 [Dactylosporangium sp.]|nr:hypothetical protein [Dactylosporangium sp.]NNJ63608.1 hypothetical protein [Dactylosporangium sp.]